MQYDPVKKSLGKVFNKSIRLRLFFYYLLDLLLLRSWYVRCELKKWIKNAPENSSVFDAGSGFGQYVWRLSKMSKNLRITGYDIKSEQIDDCKIFFKKMGLDKRVFFKQSDLTTINETELYDLILIIDVLEHIKEDELVLQNLYKSLKKDGSLIISTPSDLCGSDNQEHSVAQNGFIDEHVRNGYNRQEIEEKMYNAGFNTIESRYTYGKPGNLAWKLSMKYPIIMLNISKLFFIFLPFYYLLTYPLSYILNCIDLKMKHKEGTGMIVKGIKN